MDKAKIRWEELHALNPRLIMLRMPAFALDGPSRNYPPSACTSRR